MCFEICTVQLNRKVGLSETNWHYSLSGAHWMLRPCRCETGDTVRISEDDVICQVTGMCDFVSVCSAKYLEIISVVLNSIVVCQYLLIPQCSHIL